MADSRYGSSAVNVASIREFVEGAQAKSKASTAVGAKTLAAGVLTAVGITFYNRRRGR
jgi:hypothetical protein